MHKDHPWGMDVHGQRYEVNYWPGDSHSGMFGGNSNWRGPIWVCDALNVTHRWRRLICNKLIACYEFPSHRVITKVLSVLRY